MNLTHAHASPKYGEGVVSWEALWERFCPEDTEEPHDDAAAAEMQRLRGLVLGQAAEVESALAMIIRRLGPRVSLDQKTLGQLAGVVRALLGPEGVKAWASQMQAVDRAVKVRNRSAHRPVRIGSSWRPYATGGGEWVAVISMLGTEMYDEEDLRRDLALQQRATEAAVRIMHAVYLESDEIA
jgi:hypothetical protein